MRYQSREEKKAIGDVIFMFFYILFLIVLFATGI